jgi:hypothetical protein
MLVDIDQGIIIQIVLILMHIQAGILVIIETYGDDYEILW